MVPLSQVDLPPEPIPPGPVEECLPVSAGDVDRHNALNYQNVTSRSDREALLILCPRDAFSGLMRRQFRALKSGPYGSSLVDRPPNDKSRAHLLSQGWRVPGPQDFPEWNRKDDWNVQAGFVVYWRKYGRR